MLLMPGKPWCPGRGSNPYAPSQEAADFKSAVSTSFTTRAVLPRTIMGGDTGARAGGAAQSRTGLIGFAIRCITALLPRRWNIDQRKREAAASLDSDVDTCGAGDEARTRDLNLGKVALYQLSYSRKHPPEWASRNYRAITLCRRCRSQCLMASPPVGTTAAAATSSLISGFAADSSSGRGCGRLCSAISST